jgi:hypothetical protein
MESAFPDPFHQDDGTRPGLRALRAAFGLASIALGAQTADLFLHAWILLARDRNLFELVGRPEFAWYVGTPITWGAALASYLLLGLVPAGRPRVAAFALASMNTFDIFLWLADHATELHITLPLAWLRDPWIGQAVRVFQWFELLIFAELASGTIRRLKGDDAAPAAAQGVRATASLGLVVWALAFAMQTAWFLGGFRRRDPRLFAEMQLLGLLSILLLGATAFQATILCATAARTCAASAREARRREDDDALLRPQDDDSLWR